MVLAVIAVGRLDRATSVPGLDGLGEPVETVVFVLEGRVGRVVTGEFVTDLDEVSRAVILEALGCGVRRLDGVEETPGRVVVGGLGVGVPTAEVATAIATC
jgi:hypothetical protein